MTPEARLAAWFREAREARGLTPASLARQLNLPLAFIEAMESGAWDRLPSGRERPLARQVAERLGLDPADHPELWAMLPGELVEEPLDPRQDQVERRVTVVLSLASVGALVWLFLPGPNLRNPKVEAPQRALRTADAAAPTPAALVPGQTYPVLGEALPEAPRTDAGVLVSFRTQDACEARVQGEGLDLARALQVSQPWRIRVKGPFQVSLSNAGVVTLEVAGRTVPHGQSVGERWSGTFTSEALWQRPAPPVDEVPTRPDTDPDEPSEE